MDTLYYSVSLSHFSSEEVHKKAKYSSSVHGDEIEYNRKLALNPVRRRSMRNQIAGLILAIGVEGTTQILSDALHDISHEGIHHKVIELFIDRMKYHQRLSTPFSQRTDI